MIELTVVLDSLRRRAKRSRHDYHVCVSWMISVILLLVAIFVYGTLPFLSIYKQLEDSKLFLVGSVIGRLGAVVVGIFGIQVLFSFARYHARLAEHLEGVADALELTEGNLERVSLLISAISPLEIDFGKYPRSPFDKMMEVMGDLVKKVPDHD